MSTEATTAVAPPPAAAPARKQMTVVDTVRKMEPEFRAALPSHITPEKFTRVAVSAINATPELANGGVEKTSLLSSVMKAAQDGLVLDGREAALVIFTSKGVKKAQYLPMVAGVLKKMRNSGEISTISTGVVYKKEYETGRFKYVKGDTESLIHDPILFEEKGAQIGVYAVVTLKDGGKIREFMDMDQIAKVRKVSRSSSSEHGPWNTWFEEMCIKSVLKKVAKLCPQSTDIEQILNDDDDAFATGSSTPAVIQAGTVEAAETDAKPRRQTRAASVVKGDDQTDSSSAPSVEPSASSVVDADYEDVTDDDTGGQSTAEAAVTPTAPAPTPTPHGAQPPL